MDAYSLISLAVPSASAAWAKCSGYFDFADAVQFRRKKSSVSRTSSSRRAYSGCIRRVPDSSWPMKEPLTNSRAPSSSWLRPDFSRAWRSSAPRRARGDEDGSRSFGPGMVTELPVAQQGLLERPVWPG